MSIVNDEILIGILVCVLFYLIIRYFLLKQKFISQQEFFIKTLKHDLRVSTLAQIRALEVVLKHKETQNQELIQDIYNSCKYTFEMISMLLESYKLETRKKVLNYELVNLSDIINQGIDELGYLLTEKNIRVCSTVNKSEVVSVDRNQILNVIKSLIFTAYLNSGKNREINISINKRHKNLEISVCYKGERLEKTFSSKTTFSTVGYEIKMLLCNKIIKFHSGKFQISHNNNTNFLTFTLPNVKKKYLIKPPMWTILQPNNI